ncbi:uncharacterized protein LOC131940628 [Physella acuta]|uniref:uncharacterized protein LOC131940628 n=1 Tax=Physella acuta TaxID=109671 RepID=UPI0027DE62E0|nr:uncharacterized protein LOC131940628 [Physella acuta]
MNMSGAVPTSLEAGRDGLAVKILYPGDLQPVNKKVEISDEDGDDLDFDEIKRRILVAKGLTDVHNYKLRYYIGKDKTELTQDNIIDILQQPGVLEVYHAN